MISDDFKTVCCFDLGLRPALKRVQRTINIQLLMFGHHMQAATVHRSIKLSILVVKLVWFA